MAFSDYNEYIESNVSEKIIIAHVHGFKRIYNFSTDGSIVSKQLPHFVSNVKSGLTSLTRVASVVNVTDETKYYFDPTTSKLYLYEYDNDLHEIIVEYRFFFSNVPVTLSWDLSNDGEEVEYRPRIQSTPSLKSKMTQGKKGINLMGKGSLVINNNDGWFDSIYDSLFFDNKDVNIYAYNRQLSYSQSKQIFRGAVTGKTFSSKAVTFNLSDYLYKLDKEVSIGQFGDGYNAEGWGDAEWGTEAWGSGSILDGPDKVNYKRLIYGKADNVLCHSLDKNYDGYTLTGTLAGVDGASVITGTGTLFLTEVTAGDSLYINGLNTSVDKVISDTEIEVGELEATFSGYTGIISPQIPYSNKNRTHAVAGHSLKKASATITGFLGKNRVDIADASIFDAGDEVEINGEFKDIRRISGNTIVLETNLSDSPTIGDTISRNEIYNVRYGTDGTVIDPSQYTIYNEQPLTYIVLSSSAEKDSAKTKTLNESFSFFNGETTVWLGKPSILDIACVAHTAGSLYGTYFTIFDNEGTSTAIWFSTGSTTEPAHGKDDDLEIILSADDLTDAQVASETFDALIDDLDFFQGSVTDNDINLQTIKSMRLDSPTANTSGFTTSLTVQGVNLLTDTDLTEFIEPRDFVRIQNGTNELLKEVLDVSAKAIQLRAPYTGADTESILIYKNVNYIGDDTPVYVNCYGRTKDNTSTGEFIKDGPSVVEDVLKLAGLEDFIDTASFAEASEDAPQQFSMVIPDKINGKPKNTKTVINSINKSLLGSLYVDGSLNLGYDILDAEVETDIRTITDNDIKSWSIKTDGFDLSETVIGEYRPLEYDPTVEDASYSEVSYTSNFVKKYVGNQNTSRKELFLYNESDAQEMVERDQYINSLSNSTIVLKGGLSLAKFALGERVFLDINRLYISLGSSGNSSYRVGIVTALDNTGEAVTLEIEDLGALFSRSSRVSDDSSPEFSASTSTEKVINSFIVGENETIDDDEDTFSTNLIS